MTTRRNWTAWGMRYFNTILMLSWLSVTPLSGLLLVVPVFQSFGVLLSLVLIASAITNFYVFIILLRSFASMNYGLSQLSTCTNPYENGDFLNSGDHR